ncbi:MAG: Trm112 family protein [Nitrospirales bacterium]
MGSEIPTSEKGIIAPDLLAILCCPETKKGLSLLKAEEVVRLNQRIKQGEVKNKGGQLITEPLDGGLLREDKQIVYAIRDQIPIMLIEEGIVVESNDLLTS